jgi:hypothetical protein
MKQQTIQCGVLQLTQMLLFLLILKCIYNFCVQLISDKIQMASTTSEPELNSLKLHLKLSFHAGLKLGGVMNVFNNIIVYIQN